MVLPECIINEEADEFSEDGLSNNDDDESNDSSENCEDGHIPNGSLQGKHANVFIALW